MMDKALLGELRRQLQVEISPLDLSRSLVLLHRKQRRRESLRAGAAALTLCVAVAASLALWRGRPASGPPPLQSGGAPAPPVASPGPRGLALSCLVDQQHGPACLTAEEHQTNAATACQALGLELSASILAPRCPQGGHRGVRYTCCPAALRGACVVQDHSEMECSTAPGWARFVRELCEQQGLRAPSRPLLSEPCESGGHRRARFLCCAQTQHRSPLP